MRSFGELLLVAAASVAVWVGCAADVVPVGNDDDETTTGAGGTTSAGGASMVGGMGGAGAGVTGPCGTDCSAIQTPECYESVCNEGMHAGPVGQCVVVPSDGGDCDDGQFCTTNDTCNVGVCEGGPANDCGMTPGDCDEITCDESSHSCSLTPIPNGQACSSTDFCLVGTTCQNGLCGGGQLKDCFFAPVPNECHVAICNPQNGMCEPEPGNDGQTCTDTSDLCTVDKTCSTGTCTGGTAKNCSGMTQGCNLGVCDTVTGQCTTMPVGQGMACDDLNFCTSGEICNSGSCGGGTSVTQCVGGDFCCPAGCTEVNDTDCGCSVNHALSATPSSSGGGTGQNGPIVWNNGINESQSCSQGWISNETTANGEWMQYDFAGLTTVGSFYVDAAPCSGGGCNNGRTLASATVQWWNGASWITAGTISNPQGGDVSFAFNPPVTTAKLRLFDVTAGTCGTQQSNTLTYEWYVWSGTACSP